MEAEEAVLLLVEVRDNTPPRFLAQGGWSALARNPRRTSRDKRDKQVAVWVGWDSWEARTLQATSKFRVSGECAANRKSSRRLRRPFLRPLSRSRKSPRRHPLCPRAHPAQLAQTWQTYPRFLTKKLVLDRGWPLRRAPDLAKALYQLSQVAVFSATTPIAG